MMFVTAISIGSMSLSESLVVVLSLLSLVESKNKSLMSRPEGSGSLIQVLTAIRADNVFVEAILYSKSVMAQVTN